MITTILCLKNDIAEFQQLARAIEEFGSGHLLSKQVIHNSTLALEEVFSNIINHAYGDDRIHDITCQIHLKNKQFNIKVIDDGQPFNPLSTPPPDIHTPIDNRCLGGLGIYLMRKLTDAVEYQRIEDKNILTLKINLTNDTQR